jgi:hypothetical protein
MRTQVDAPLAGFGLEPFAHSSCEGQWFNVDMGPLSVNRLADMHTDNIHTQRKITAT